MSLSVDVYTIDDDGKMVIHDPENYPETLAGFEVYRTTLYGSELAKILGLRILPTLANGDVYAEGQVVDQLQSEAEIMMLEASAFAEKIESYVEHVKQRAENIRSACIRARKTQANVVIW